MLDKVGFDFLKEMMHAQGLEMHAFIEPYTWLSEFDKGLRSQLYLNFDYSIIAQELETKCRKHCIYTVRDAFGVCYVIFGGTKWEDKYVYITIGPYLDEGLIPDAAEMVRKNYLELYHMGVLKEYYNSLPTVGNVESMVYVFGKYSGVEFHIESIELEFGESEGNLELKIEDEDGLSMALIEERYQFEDEMLNAVEHGDTTKLALLQSGTGKYRLEARSRDSFRDDKNMVLTQNVLFRKAVQNARVHPAHIDAISASFARRIENSRTRVELSKVASEMGRKYCHLVQSYSLKGYSDLIENVINYIDFHLKEPLSLGCLAEKFAVNASYLSGQFKKETNATLTAYLNEKRIQSSLILLATTTLPVQEVAARVGIYDENYFSRLFKKHRQITPREYRSTVREIHK